MTKLQLLALACGVTLAVGPLVPVAPAQGKPPPNDSKQTKKKSAQPQANDQSGGYRFVSGDETLTSGDKVTISRKGKGKLTGVFVYADPKTGNLYVRPKAGQRPVAVPENSIEKIERIRPAVGTTGKGGVRPAIEGGEKAAPSYEIHTLRIHNGPHTTIHFFDTSLSPGERDQLNALEQARASMMQKQAELDSLNRAIENAAAGPAVAVVQGGGGMGMGMGYPYYYPAYAGYGYYRPWYSPWILGWPGMSYGWTNYAPSLPGWGWPAYYGGGGGSTVVVENGGGSGQDVAALSKALGEAQTALADARKNYIAASQRAIFDSDGRIVAVRLAE